MVDWSAVGLAVVFVATIQLIALLVIRYVQYTLNRRNRQ